MKTAASMLIALVALASSSIAIAKEAGIGPIDAKPINPGSWISPNDYPAIALRLKMIGKTAFTLNVDATGKPAGCEIVESSGFDVLDSATCEYLMAKGRFSPARDQAGNPANDTYSSAVRWELPEGAQDPVSEIYTAMLVSIDESGDITSCKHIIHNPANIPFPNSGECTEAWAPTPPPDIALEIRDGIGEGLAHAELRVATTFTTALRAEILAPVPGYEQKALSVHQFKVTSDGQLVECRYEEQRGSERMVNDFCGEAQSQTFDPPFSAFDKEGMAEGWRIIRVLLKTGP